jgi:hypothetical protein
MIVEDCGLIKPWRHDSSLQKMKHGYYPVKNGDLLFLWGKPAHLLTAWWFVASLSVGHSFEDRSPFFL